MRTKRIVAAVAAGLALLIPAGTIAASSHAPVAGGFGEFPLKK